MIEKEIAEIRRRFRPDKSNIPSIRGCCVNEKGEIVSEFNQSLMILQQEESEKMLALLKKSLSGTLGKNLVDITFSTAQVADSEEHRLLMKLKDSGLKDEEAVHAFFDRVIQGTSLEGNFLILLAHDSYDVPYRAKDGEQLDDASSEVFSYIVCSICPVKMTKPALGYYLNENAFRTCSLDWIVSAPEMGFLFPAFDDRCANIYNALYYSRDTKENHKEFVDAVFVSQIPMPAAIQKETFETILSESLDEECSYDTVQAVHAELCGLIEEHKANKEEEPLVISKNVVKGVLASCGVHDEHIQAFDEKFNEEFGPETELRPGNLVDARQVEIHSADVTIRFKPECSDLVETRVIDGVRYILIRAEEGVEVNGVSVHIPKEVRDAEEEPGK